MTEQDLSQQPSQREQYAALLSWLAFLCQALEASIAVFMRRGFGRRFFGAQAAAVIPLVLVYTLFWPEEDPRPFIGFLGAYLVAIAIARVDSVRRTRAGEVQHSHYSGTPCLLRAPAFRRSLSESTAKSTVEPLFVMAVGALTMQWNEPLGSYFIVAAVGQWLSIGMARAYDEQRLMDARDAYFEQQHLAERFRKEYRR